MRFILHETGYFALNIRLVCVQDLLDTHGRLFTNHVKRLYIGLEYLTFRGAIE